MSYQQKIIRDGCITHLYINYDREFVSLKMKVSHHKQKKIMDKIISHFTWIVKIK
jgi:hypothetical protein